MSLLLTLPPSRLRRRFGFSFLVISLAALHDDGFGANRKRVKNLKRRASTLLGATYVLVCL